MTFTEVMDRIGLDATSEQYCEAFKNSRYDVWHANAGARRLLNAGVKAPWSGHPQYNIHANDIDFQIESDFIGLMTPGLPREANKYADRVGDVMTYGDGVYGGMFFAGMYAAAFFEHDPRRVVEAGLRSIPAQSGYAKVRGGGGLTQVQRGGHRARRAVVAIRRPGGCLRRRSEDQAARRLHFRAHA
jgi:hypothetical protein